MGIGEKTISVIGSLSGGKQDNPTPECEANGTQRYGKILLNYMKHALTFQSFALAFQSYILVVIYFKISVSCTLKYKLPTDDVTDGVNIY